MVNGREHEQAPNLSVKLQISLNGYMNRKDNCVQPLSTLTYVHKMSNRKNHKKSQTYNLRRVH